MSDDIVLAGPLKDGKRYSVAITGGYFRLGGHGRPDFTIRSTTVWRLQRLGLVDRSPVRATEAGRRWLAEHDHAG